MAAKKKSGSMAAFMKAESKESASTRKKEYGSPKGGMHKMPNGKIMLNSAMPKKMGAKKMGAKKK